MLKRALVPSDGKWRSPKEVKEVLVLGEPLFEVVLTGKPIDAEAVIGGILKGMPEAYAAQYRQRIPYFNLEGK